MRIANTSELNFNDTLKYINKEQYERDFSKYQDDFESFLSEKNKLKETINSIDDLDFNNIQYFKASELKEMFPNNEDSEKAYYLKRVSDFSNDDELNKLLFNKAKEYESSEEVSNMLVILNYEKNFTKNREFDFPSKLNLRPYYNENNPLDSEFKFKDENKILDFLDAINYHLNRGNEGPESQGFATEFREIRKRYEEQMGENNALFTQMTKYTKPQSLEEAQKQKHEENISKAMKAFGLNPKEDFDRFTFGIMQEGYSKEEAYERTNIYSYVGLVPRNSCVRKFGIEELYNQKANYLTQNPTLKQSLMESFSKMDTEQLKEVGHSIGSEFGLSVNDIHGYDVHENDIHLSKEEFEEKVDEFWKEKFGSVQEIINMFNEKLEPYILEHEKGVKDYTYVFDAFEILIDTLLENSKKNIDIPKNNKITKEEKNHTFYEQDVL